MAIILRELTEHDESAFFEGMKLWEGESPHWYTFSWKPGMSYQEMHAILVKESAGIDLRPERVPHSMLYAFLDGKIVGRVSVRHQLNEMLRYRGGHIGYAVAKDYRRRGYATEMVRQSLVFCRKLGLQSIMVTCSDSNEASWKVIERFDGKLQDKVWDNQDNEMIRRYWITLPFA